MRIISRKLRAMQAAQAWRSQYFVGAQWGRTVSGDTKVVYDKLVSLGNSPKPEKVNEVIGNDSWTNVHCHECGQKVDKVVQVGEPEDYQSATAGICASCATNAFELIHA